MASTRHFFFAKVPWLANVKPVTKPGLGGRQQLPQTGWVLYFYPSFRLCLWSTNPLLSDSFH